MFDFIPALLKYVMVFCDKISFHNYALSLLLFALIIKVLLFPFGIKTQKNQVKAAKLRPKEMHIRNKYKGRTDNASQQKMATEIQEMYREEGHNQFGGCLPMLIQFPILFALYEIIRNPLYYVCSFTKAEIEVITDTFQKIKGYVSAASLPELKVTSYLAESKENITELINNLPVDGSLPTGVEANSYGEFINDLTVKLTNTDNIPNFKVFGFIDLSVSPNEQIWWYILFPIAIFIVLFATMKIQKKFTYQMQATDAQSNMSMKMMDYTMPALSAVMSFSLPSALGLYWMYQNVLGLAQQIVLSKMFPYPKFTDAEIREMERAAEKAEQQAKKAKIEEKKKLKAERQNEDEDAPRRAPMTVEEEEEQLRRLSEALKAPEKKKKNKDDKDKPTLKD